MAALFLQLHSPAKFIIRQRADHMLFRQACVRAGPDLGPDGRPLTPRHVLTSLASCTAVENAGLIGQGAK